MIKRTIDRILSEGEGRQLAWLAALALTLFLVLVLIGSFWALATPSSSMRAAVRPP